MIFSSYQEDIFREIEKRENNIAVNAVAGSGKTFTIVHGIKKIPNYYSVLMAAFGKDIAENLRSKDLPFNVTVATYNAFGWGLFKKVRLDADKTDKLLKSKVPWKDFIRLKGPVKRLVSLMKSQLVFEPTDTIVKQLCEHHQIEVPDQMDLLMEIYKSSINDIKTFDFDDQIFQVLHQGLQVPQFDFVFVDEYQDTNEMQNQMMKKAGGLFYAVGDPDQAIYGFRGATPDAFAKLQAKELPLSISYRCPVAVVNEAKKIVPRIEAAPGSIDGTVDSITTDQFLSMVKPGDFVLCRTVAPLVKRCFQQIRNHNPATVLGREIGRSLEWLIDKVSHDAMRIDEFYQRLSDHVSGLLDSYAKTNRDNAALDLEDRFETIVNLTDGCSIVAELKNNLKEVFQDKKDSIKFMTIHKSKGLENERVFVLRPDLLPHPRSKAQWMREEEARLQYVAITRSKNSLFWVQKERNEK